MSTSRAANGYPPRMMNEAEVYELGPADDDEVDGLSPTR